MIDIVAMGELLIDFTPGGINSKGMKMFTQNSDGAPANVLAMNARLGGKTAFIGKVGQDAFGAFLQDVLEENGIDTSGLVLNPTAPTTLAFVHLDEKGNRSFSFYRSPGADQMLAPKEAALNLIDDCGVFHFGSVSLTHDPSRSAVFHAAEYAKKQCKLVSFDPNIRPMPWEDMEDDAGGTGFYEPRTDETDGQIRKCRRSPDDYWQRRYSGYAHLGADSDFHE